MNLFYFNRQNKRIEKISQGVHGNYLYTGFSDDGGRSGLLVKIEINGSFLGRAYHLETGDRINLTSKQLEEAYKLL